VDVAPTAEQDSAFARRSGERHLRKIRFARPRWGSSAARQRRRRRGFGVRDRLALRRAMESGPAPTTDATVNRAVPSASASFVVWGCFADTSGYQRRSKRSA